MSISDSRDATESDIKRLLDDLLQCASTCHARTVLRDAVWAIDDRANARTDTMSRDHYVEQRVRDVLGELSKPGSPPQNYIVAIEFVDALLSVDFTERNYKFARLCRSLLAILQCGLDGIVKTAQKVFIRMVEMDVAVIQRDPHTQTPLKDFLPKELKEMCEIVSREADGRGTPSRNRALAVMIASEAVMMVYPRYFSASLRVSLIDLSVDLCGRSDLSVRCAAYDCLVATLSSTGGMKASDVQAESRRLTEECTKSLRGSYVSEHQTTSSILSTRALLVSRGVAAADKPFFNMFCTALLEQHKKAKGELVRSAVCSLVPIVARADPNFALRKITYATILMDPLKNIRDESNKMTELHNMAEYLRSAGYDSLDPSMKPSVEQLLLRYVTRPQTLLECWNMIAAIASQFGPSSSSLGSPTSIANHRALPAPAQNVAHHRPGEGAAARDGIAKLSDIVRRCLPSLTRAPMTNALLKYLDHIKGCLPIIASEIALSQRTLVDVVLRRAAQAESTPVTASQRQSVQMSWSSPMQPFLGSPAALVGGTPSGPPPNSFSSPMNSTAVGTSATATSRGNVDTSGRPFAGLGRLVSSYFHRGGSSQPTADSDEVLFVSAAEIEVALVALSKRPVEDFSALVEELRVNILALQKHSSSEVRRQCSQTILECVELACSAAGHNQQRISPESAGHFFSRVEDLLESYLKNAVMELEPQCRMSMVEAFCSSRSAMQLINRSKILNTLMSFLNDTSRIREVVVRALVEACQALKKDGVNVDEVESQLKVTVETSVVALEYSSETRLLLRHLNDLVIFTRFGIDPILPLLARTFVALNRKLGSSELEMDVVVLNILKTLKCLITPLISQDSIGSRFLDEVATLQTTVLNIFWNCTAPVVSIEAVRVLVALNNVSPVILNIPPSEAMRTIESLSLTFLDSKVLPKEDLVAIMTLYGQLGALRPTKGTLETRSEDEQSKLASDADLVITYDYAVIVYRSVSRMLETSLPELVACHAMRVLLQLVHATSKEEIGGVHALKAVLNLIKLRCDTPTLRVEALYQLAALVGKRHENAVAFMLSEIVVLLDQLWLLADGAQFYAVLQVITALEPAKLHIKDQHDMWPWLYPRLIDAVLRDTSPNREVALRIVEIVRINATSIPPHCVPFITSALTSVVQQSDQPPDLRSAAIIAVIEVMNSLDLIQHVTPLLHALRTLHRHLELSTSLARRFGVDVRDALRRFMKKFPSSRTIVSGVVDLLESETNANTNFDDDEMTSPLHRPAANPLGLYGNVLTTTESSRTLDGNDHRAPTANSDNPDFPTATHSEPNRADVANLQSHVERGIRITDHSRWKEWFQELQRLVMLCSPHFAFRLVTDLFEKHEPLRRELFFAGFKCLYESLAPEQVRRVNMAIAQAVASNDGEVSAKCLALADYLDHNKPLWETGRAGAANGGAAPREGTVGLSYLPSMQQRHTPIKTLTRDFPSSGDGLDDPEFFHSPASIGRIKANAGGTAARQKRAGGSSLLPGSMVFPITPQSVLPGIAPRRRLGSGQQAKGRLAAASDLHALHDSEGRMSFPDSSATPHATDVQGRSRATGRAASRQLGKATTGLVLLPGESPLLCARVMIEAAQNAAMFDKAIRFLEMRLVPFLGASVACGKSWKPLEQSVLESVVLPLSQLYSNLGMQASVVGLFSAIHYLESQETTGIGLELLRQWSDARCAYSNALSRVSPSRSLLPSCTDQDREGYVRTLCLCGEWRSALAAAKELLRSAGTASPAPSQTSSTVSNISVSGATAAWILSEWGDVADFAERITHEPLQYFFVNAVVFNHKSSDAHQESSHDQLVCIRHARLSLEASLKALLPVSYSHAYDNITLLQNFQEIWEAVAFRRAKTALRRNQIKDMWAARFSSMKADNWFQKLRSLMIHSLVLAPAEMPNTWLQFCESVRATYPQLANWAMRSLQLGRLASTASDDIPSSVVDKGSPSVRVGYFMHLWNTGRLGDAVHGMQNLVSAKHRTSSYRLEEDDPRSYGMGHLRLGLWKQEMHVDTFWKSELRDEIIDHLHSAIRSCPDDYDTWHAWALMNYRIQQRESDLDRRSQSIFVSKAHEGFVAAICLSPSAAISLQDVMRLLQLWFVQGGVSTLKESIADGVQRISVEHWIHVVPQLIAHLGHDSHDVRDVVFRILQKIAVAHPQVVVFPLLVNTLQDPNVLPSDTLSHREVLSVALLDKHVPQRVKRDAEWAARQLCAAALLPIEHILEQMILVADEWASFDAVHSVGSPTSRSAGGTPFLAADAGEDNNDFPTVRDVAAAAALQPKQNSEKISPNEEESTRALRRLMTVLYIYKNNPSLCRLGDIGKYTTQVIEYSKSGMRDAARALLTQLIDEITDHVKRIRKLGEDALKSVEPLATVRNLSVCMFGEYNWVNPAQVPTIASFSPQCDVIRSKKRPRKIRVTGSNGSVYAFLLKSNEDIRLDERVMQLFGLINSFVELEKHSASCSITKFPVVPISANVGLLGWVEYSDTLHDVISNYRILSNSDGFLERTLLSEQFDEPFEELMRKTWSSLQNVQRAEAFETVFNAPSCESADLARSMWQRAPSAEVWLGRRTSFTESLATMSMVGYVLGLGDRHMGNIMLNMSSGRIAHIDFGDSFDVCRVRSVLPETVPFRLTRILIHAMEVFGVDGVYRSTCVSILSLLHHHRDSIIALLSAFIYDPIVSHQESMRSILERQSAPQNIVERIRNKLRGLELAVPDHQFQPFDHKGASTVVSRPDVHFVSHAFNDSAKRDVSAALAPRDQVEMLIAEATSMENLSSMYHGWAPLW